MVEFLKMDCENKSSGLYFEKNKYFNPPGCNTPLIVAFSGKEKEEIRQTCGATVWRPVVMWRGSNRRLRGDIVRRQYH